jgi:hypothetical protein
MGVQDDYVLLDGPGSMIPVLSSVCSLCHLLRLREGRTCAALPEPDSIPLPIWLGEHDHQERYPGDHGIRFEPVDTQFARAKLRKPSE